MRKRWADGLREKAKQQSSDKKPVLSGEKRERERKRERKGPFNLEEGGRVKRLTVWEKERDKEKGCRCQETRT